MKKEHDTVYFFSFLSVSLSQIIFLLLFCRLIICICTSGDKIKMNYTYLNEKTISSSLICPICLDVLQDPHTHVSCDSAFCRSCLLQLTESICPICRWHWDDYIPIEYNKSLPKTNRLIRNMLDELAVQCLHCKTIRRRGQFEHDCQPIVDKKIVSKKIDYAQMILLFLMFFFSSLILYLNHKFLFEPVDHQQKPVINNFGMDIDKYLFEKIYYLIVQSIEYSLVIFLFNFSLWLSIIIYGDRLGSKHLNKYLRKFLEFTIIINLIGYSISN